MLAAMEKFNRGTGEGRDHARRRAWEVRSMEEAVEWAKRCPNPMPGPSDLEIRPLWESEDFDPEIVAQVNALRKISGYLI